MKAIYHEMNQEIVIESVHQATVAGETTMMEWVVKRLQMRTKTSLADLQNLENVLYSTKLLTRF